MEVWRVLPNQLAKTKTRIPKIVRTATTMTTMTTMTMTMITRSYKDAYNTTQHAFSLDVARCKILHGSTFESTLLPRICITKWDAACDRQTDVLYQQHRWLGHGKLGRRQR